MSHKQAITSPLEALDPAAAALPHAYEKLRKAYIIGFVLSLVFTLTTYSFVYAHQHHQTLSRHMIFAVVILLALVQCTIQLIYFLHLKPEAKKRWQLLVFGLMIGVVAIVVFGSVWIMDNLNYHMSPSQINTYMSNQDGL